MDNGNNQQNQNPQQPQQVPQTAVPGQSDILPAVQSPASGATPQPLAPPDPPPHSAAPNPVPPAPTGAAMPIPGMTEEKQEELDADDNDLIEKEWVERAKSVIEKTKSDPHQQNKELNRFKADYVKKRYNKELKVTEG